MRPMVASRSESSRSLCVRLQLHAHAFERAAQLANLFHAVFAEPVVEIAQGERAGAFDQRLDGMRKRAGDGDQHCRAGEQRAEHQREHPAVDAAQELRGLLERLQHHELRRCISLRIESGAERDRRCEVFLAAQLDVAACAVGEVRSSPAWPTSCCSRPGSSVLATMSCRR